MYGLHHFCTPMNPTDSHTRSPRYWLMKSEPQECSFDDALAASIVSIYEASIT